MFKASLNPQKLKTNLRLCINRLKMLEKKKTELAVKARKEIADYLQVNKDDRARIRVEHIIREDYMVEAMEIIEMYCDLLLARMGLIDGQKELDPGLEESIATIIWVTPRLEAEVPELKIVVDQFTRKYGKEWVMASRANEFNKTNPKVEHKLSVRAPDPMLVERYLVEIAKTYNIQYEPHPGIPDFEVMNADDLLINLNDRKGSSGSGHSGGGGSGMPVVFNNVPSNATTSTPFSYPLTQNQSIVNTSKNITVTPPPIPANPPVPGPYTKNSGINIPSYEEATQSSKAVSKINNEDDVLNLPELPRVPSTDLLTGARGGNPGTSSAGGEDVDFDDLTRRFAELKKKK